MPCQRHEWQLTLCLKAPFATTGVENAAHGIDTAFLRDEEGNIILSGHQVRGLFRHFLYAVIQRENDAGITDDRDRLVPLECFFDWFGRPGIQYGAGEGDPKIYKDLGAENMRPPDPMATDDGRGRLTIRDLVLQGDAARAEGTGDTNRTRIRVDRERRSVMPGMLLVREQLHKTGEVVTFDSGAAGVVLYGDEEQRQAFERAFRLFLDYLPEIGAMKAAGYGRLVGFDLDHRGSRPLCIPDRGPNGDAFALRLRFSHPLLVEPRLASGNVQESAEHVSGAVLKAAIAEFGRLADADFESTFGDALTNMVIRFALPVERNGRMTRPRAIPFSCVKCGDRFADAFSPDVELGPVTFPTDFKARDREKVEKNYGIHEPRRVSQTRTAIEPGAQHAAEGQLFNYRLLGVKETDWIAEIILPEDMTDEEKDKARRLVALLQEGVVQVGRTRADLAVVEVEEAPMPKVEQSDGIWRITLQTPAALFDIDDINKLRKGADLREMYVAYFRRVLKSAADCINWDNFDFLAQHWLAGGHRTSATRRRAQAAYYPFLLTEAGSVFILPQKEDCHENKLQERLNEIAACGLPTYDPDWKTNPYQPQNGYGEVRIDDVDRRLAMSMGGASGKPKEAAHA